MSPFRERLCLGGLAALTVLSYARVWSAWWVYDDTNWVQTAGWPWTGLWWAGGGLPWAFHGFVLSLHLLNGGLLWWLVRSRLGSIGSLTTLTLFWLHPIHVEAVAYVSGGIEALLTFYALVTAISWSCGGPIGLLLGLWTLGLAIRLKFSAWPLLVLLPVVTGRLRHWRIAALMGIVAGVALWPRLPQLGLHSLPAWSDLTRVTNALWRYLCMVIWPVGFSIEHDWYSVPAWVGLLTVGLTVLSGVLAFRHRSRWAAPWWAWIWIVGLVLPRAVVPNAPPLTEHHVMAPFLAIWLLIGSAIDRLQSSRDDDCDIQRLELRSTDDRPSAGRSIANAMQRTSFLVWLLDSASRVYRAMDCRRHRGRAFFDEAHRDTPDWDKSQAGHHRPMSRLRDELVRPLAVDDPRLIRRDADANIRALFRIVDSVAQWLVERRPFVIIAQKRTLIDG